MKHRYGWKPDLKDHRDKLYRLIRPSIGVPNKVDLRPQMPPVVDQGQLGSCTANALAGAVEFMELKDKAIPAYIPLSRLFLYYNERAIEGDINQDGGAQIRDGVKSLNQQGICTEALWPYNISKFADTPDDVSVNDALTRKIVSYHRLTTFQDMLTCLAEGFPFALGISVYDSFESAEVAKTGIVPMPGSGESVLGGHAVLAVGFDQAEEVFIIRNSWGSDWGMAGYCTIPFSYVEKIGSDFWTLRS